jgi:hypothetical protein
LWRSPLQKPVGNHRRTMCRRVSSQKFDSFSNSYNTSGVLFVITLGSVTLKGDDPNRLTLSTSEYFLHPDYNPDTLENDLGLIKLRMPITFTGKVYSCVNVSIHVVFVDYIRPIAPLAMHELPAKPNLRVIGWGESSIGK